MGENARSQFLSLWCRLQSISLSLKYLTLNSLVFSPRPHDLWASSLQAGRTAGRWQTVLDLGYGSGSGLCLGCSRLSLCPLWRKATRTSRSLCAHTAFVKKSSAPLCSPVNVEASKKCPIFLQLQSQIRTFFWKFLGADNSLEFAREFEQCYL